MALPEPLGKFFRDRGPHLAAMIAYFALLSFVPLLFLAVSALGLAGRPDESSYLVTELKRAFPGSSVASIVHTVDEIRRHSTALGIIGGAALVWASLSLFSVLESAFNIVYGQPNRSFLRGKLLAVALMLLSLVTLFVGLLAGSIGVDLIKRYVDFLADNSYVAYGLSVAVSLLAVFVFLVSVYYLLTNVEHTFAEVLPGAVFAALALEASFQVLPLYVRYSNNVVALKAFGGPVLLLVWLYVMANVIVLGAEVNWWLTNRGRPSVSQEAAGLA
ncbi:MAG TPA: YihY/virulence factor BrkB family protein [Gaiellaceae bacterium]|jgi:membrane protein|nr:YihY/virulence factor BrkB family protein [Gaiellaceae bacterium]